MPTADVDGIQRKIIRSSVRPLRVSFGDAGIPLREGTALPFVVERGWNAPMGYYVEAWYLVLPSTGEVLYEGGGAARLIKGLPTVTDLRDEVEGGFRLEPGDYKVVFALDGYKGGEIDVSAFEVSAEEAA